MSNRSRKPRERGRAYDPYAHAEELGLAVIFRPLRVSHERWLPDAQTIVIQESLRSVHRRNALAHGIAHCVLGHEDDRPKHEAQADRFAASNLIDLDEFRAIARWAPDLEHLVAELGVTTRLARAFVAQHLDLAQHADPAQQAEAAPGRAHTGTHD
ncbi:ImmA/IrrE family metallo-endopeptidase [Plantibacter sp. PA-3-X8]|uniref:ImmA/IrrE family metallo-endopeptidase n=1 Tax=Plantibacter sp. PA-3-X8 TaxID=2480625 RepID=UPI0013DD97A7|nr:ImmA/IrrE family metallo-endopeptidase [Plantibacter sp. PA-3-X8]